MASALDLPDMRVRKPDVYTYAKMTNIPTAAVRKRLPHVRSLIAFVVNKPTGKHWGVLVVDSKENQLDIEEIARAFSSYKEILKRIVNVL